MFLLHFGRHGLIDLPIAASCHGLNYQIPMKNILIATFCLMPLATMTSCKEKGPAEKVGDKIDKVGEDIKDAVDPKGPAEKAGEKVDKALGH